ncbi:MAG TPA: hypothetical protein VH761_00345, partial [Ilumatobacteraceae bacterium]|jgi:hypothetical protein
LTGSAIVPLLGAAIIEAIGRPSSSAATDVIESTVLVPEDDTGESVEQARTVVEVGSGAIPE